MSILFYKKPELSRNLGALSENSCQRYVERAAGSGAAIPEELSFKNVIEDRALPPCSLQDFLDYLIYVTHDAENLQFYLWYKDYCKRFNTAPGWKKDLSPLWTQTANKTRLDPAPVNSKKHNLSPNLKTSSSPSPLPSPVSPVSALSVKTLPHTPTPAQQFKEFSFESHKDVLPPAPSPAQQFKEFSFEPHKQPLLTTPDSPLYQTHSHSATPAPAAQPQPQLQLQPVDLTDCASLYSMDEKTRAQQPFRAEVERITAHYFRVGAPRELNLSSKERDNVLRAVESTTHPTAFLEVAALVETSLRYHSHRNFVRWSICNGNKPRVFVLRSLAIFVLSCTLALAFLLILSHYSRWYRLTVIPVCFFASVNLIAARQGLCVLLHRRKTREARPWEIGNDEEEKLGGMGSRMMGFGSMDSMEAENGSRNLSEKRSFFGGRNEYENEPWKARWERRSVWQKIRVQKIKIGPGGLRSLQNNILWQAEWWGLIVTLVFTGVVLAFPVFGLY